MTTTSPRYDACGWKRQEGRAYVPGLGYGQLAAVHRDGSALVRLEDAPDRLESVPAADWAQLTTAKGMHDDSPEAAR